jgi:N-acetylglucosaminyl-diphospho-decaprenol L-rhamnosyltransferase
MTNTPLVSAIVLFHDVRSASEAASCVEALRAQTVASELEVILVDNGTGGKTSELLRRFLGQGDAISMIRLQENMGYGRGNNEGASHAYGTYLLIINPDNRLDPHALKTMMQYLEAHNDVGVVGPKLIFPDGTTRDSYRTFPTMMDILIKRTPLRLFFRNRMKKYLQWEADPDHIRNVDWICGACLLMRRSHFEELKGFDPRFFLFFEDTDLCRRMRGKGLLVTYLPQAKAHDGKLRLSSGGMLSFLYRPTVRIHIASAVKYFWKWRRNP